MSLKCTLTIEVNTQFFWKYFINIIFLPVTQIINYRENVSHEPIYSSKIIEFSLIENQHNVLFEAINTFSRIKPRQIYLNYN